MIGYIQVHVGTGITDPGNQALWALGVAALIAWIFALDFVLRGLHHDPVTHLWGVLRGR